MPCTEARPPCSLPAQELSGEGEAPWCDEVTTLLLGLVLISHQKYLEGPLGPGLAEVPEAQRAAALWSAPFALLVADDSGDSRLEYVNDAAGGASGGAG